MGSKRTFAEIVAKLEEFGICPETLDNHPYMYGGDYGSYEVPAEYEGKAMQEKFNEEFGEVKEVSEASRGGEDAGSQYVRVYHFVNDDVYVKITGYYASYDGTTFDDEFQEVTPKEKTITVYE